MVSSRQAQDIYNEICLNLSRMGANNPKKFERQTLYGDILDWLRDMHPELRNNEHDDDLVAMYIIGRYSTLISNIDKWKQQIKRKSK